MNDWTNDDLLFLHKKGDFWRMDASCFSIFAAYISHYFQNDDELKRFSYDRILDVEIRHAELIANKVLFKKKYIGQEILLLTFLEPEIIAVELSDMLTVDVNYQKKTFVFHCQINFYK